MERDARKMEQRWSECVSVKSYWAELWLVSIYILVFSMLARLPPPYFEISVSIYISDDKVSNPRQNEVQMLIQCSGHTNSGINR